MRILPTVLFAGILASTVAHATDREFKDVVEAISDEFHTRPMHIPMFGLVNVVTFVARPAGTKHIDLAVFENLDTHVREGGDMVQSIRRAVGRSWKPFIQVRSRHGDETVLVYMRPEGKDCRLLITTIDAKEATIVQLRLNPEGLQKWIVMPRDSAGHHWNRDSDN